MSRSAAAPPGCPSRPRRPLRRHVGLPLALAIACLAGATRAGVVPVAIETSPNPRVFAPVTITLTGPAAREDATPNPFLDHRFELIFRHERGGAPVRVHGYFAGDGRAADSGATAGDKWRAHFTPERAGRWRYTVAFRVGPRAAITNGGKPVRPLDGRKGVLDVTDAPPGASAAGILRQGGGHYLQFSGSKAHFLKAGADSPENLLAFVDFDDTYRHQDITNRDEGYSGKPKIHSYAPHVKDWRAGDPNWRGGKGKGLIGALNYLASKGVNSAYFLTMNVQGDGKDVWPWTGPDERVRFDISKLDQWEIVFSHMDRLGIALHVVLTETENESLFEVEENSTFGDTRKLYYRELVARFSHHPALVWNLGEENGWDDRRKEATGEAGIPNTDRQRKAFATHLRKLDPYRHPIVVHTLPGRYDEIYKPLMGHPAFAGASLQMGKPEQTHDETRKWLERSRMAGQPWFVCLDEIGPADTGAMPDADDPDHDLIRHTALWGNLMAGGAGVEWYFGYKYPHNDLLAEDFRSRDRLWDQTRIAVRFFQQRLPFHEMRSMDELTPDDRDYVFAKPGEIYSVYLPPGAPAPRIELPAAAFKVAWFNPREGGPLKAGSVVQITGTGKGRVALGEPPGDPARDWVLLVTRDGPTPGGGHVPGARAAR